MDKRRRIVEGKMVGPNTTNLRHRQVLSSVNGGPGDPMPAAMSDAGSSTCTLEFSSREDAERLLSEKMKGKFKNDLKVILLLISIYFFGVSCSEWII